MQLHLISAYKKHPGLDTLVDCAAQDTEGNHALCESPAMADAIIFVENTQFDDMMFKHLLQHELVQAYASKVFMYNELDRPWEVLPGLYTCMPRKHIDPGRHQPFAYLSTPNRYVRNVFDENPPRRWLYSFMGAMSHPCRRQILRLPTDEACLKDTSVFNVWNSSAEELDVRAREYADVLGSSKFVLCPRGIGTSSLRLYETLEAGRVPVIISDQWVAPEETDWRFAIQVQEKRIASVPRLLQSLENEALERGQAARNAWLQSYASSTLFNTLGDAIQRLMTNNGHSAKAPGRTSLNKWISTGGLYTRTAVQRIRGQR